MQQKIKPNCNQLLLPEGVKPSRISVGKKQKREKFMKGWKNLKECLSVIDYEVAKPSSILTC
jgi:hypothetical protein